MERTSLTATAPASSDAIRAAVAAERARTRAWLHDTVLQVLEFIEMGGYADTPDAHALARAAGDAGRELRAFVDNDELIGGGGTLVERLHAIVESERELSDHEIVLDLGVIDAPVTGDDAVELSAATAEALRNVRKHARATRAIVSCSVVGGIVTIIVGDDGVGCDVRTAARRGAGLRGSVVGRLDRQGGSATIRSRPGLGTRVTLKLDRSPRVSLLEAPAAPRRAAAA